MSRGKIAVFDHTATRIVRYEASAGVTGMLSSGAIFVLTRDPLTVALTSTGSKTMPGRPDMSVTMGPGVTVGHADGIPRCREAVESYAKRA